MPGPGDQYWRQTQQQFRIFRERIRELERTGQKVDGQRPLQWWSSNGADKLLVEGTRPVGFELPGSQMLRVMSFLKALEIAGPKTVASELNKAVMLWKRDIVRHVPVDVGLLRESFGTALAHKGQLPYLEAAVGTNVPYAVYLEFGTRYIASGQVLNWSSGQPPIYDWPAKRADATLDRTVLEIDSEGRGRNAMGAAFRKGASQTSGAEFMPYMRGSWPLTEKVLIPRLVNALAKAMRNAAQGGAP
jgi:hypothetical protein